MAAYDTFADAASTGALKVVMQRTPDAGGPASEQKDPAAVSA